MVSEAFFCLSTITCCFQIVAPAALMDEEARPEPSGSQSDRKSSLSSNNPDILSVNELLQSVKL